MSGLGNGSGSRSGSCFDWAGLMRAGLRELRLAPRTFWSLTPYELLLMLGREGGGTVMARARLEELAAAYPDKPRP